MSLNFQLSDLASPAAQALALLVVGLLCLCRRHFRVALAFGVIAVSWIVLCAMPVFAEVLRHGLVVPYAARNASDYPTVDAIVVLGGGDPPAFGHSAGAAQSNRTAFALELFRAGRAPVIVLSGGAGEAAEMAQQLQLQGVPADALRTESDSSTTFQNAAYSAQILKREQRRQILLVTSIIPMHRAVISFEQQGLSVVPAPIFDIYGAPVPGDRWLPQYDALYQSRRYLHEYLGILAYEVRDWL